MSKILNHRLIISVAAIIVFASCSKTNKQGRYIPQEAAVIIHVNGKIMSEKLPWEELKKNPAFEKIKTDSVVPAFVKKALENPENAGIDVKSDILFFITRDDEGAYACIQGSITDAEKFRLFNIDATDNGFETKKDNVTYLTSQPVIVGFNKKMFAYVIDAPDAIPGKLSYRDRNNPKTGRDLQGTCAGIFNLSAAKSMGENKKFTELVKDDNDVHVWLKMEEFFKNNPAMEDIPFGDISKVYEDNIATACLRFDNGKVSMKMKNYYNKDITSLYKKYGNDNFNDDMAKNIPAKEVAAFLAIKLKPQLVQEMLKLTKMESMVNIAMIFMGFSLDDVTGALEGDFVLSVFDFKTKIDTVKDYFEPGKFSLRSNVEPELLVAASINEKDAMRKLNKGIDKLKEKSGMSDFSENMSSNGFSAQNDKYFAYATTQEKADNFIKGGNSSFDFMNKIKGNPVGGYLNLQMVITALKSEISTRDSFKLQGAEVAAKTFKDVYLWGGKYDDGGFVTNVEVNMTDKGTNSLKQLNDLAAVMVKLQMEEARIRNEEYKKMFQDADPKAVEIPAPAKPVIQKKK